MPVAIIGAALAAFIVGAIAGGVTGHLLATDVLNWLREHGIPIPDVAQPGPEGEV